MDVCIRFFDARARIEHVTVGGPIGAKGGEGGGLEGVADLHGPHSGQDLDDATIPKGKAHEKLSPAAWWDASAEIVQIGDGWEGRIQKRTRRRSKSARRERERKKKQEARSKKQEARRRKTRVYLTGGDSKGEQTEGARVAVGGLDHANSVHRVFL